MLLKTENLQLKFFVLCRKS